MIQLLSLHLQLGFREMAVRTEHINVDKFIQNLEEVGVRMISIDRGLFSCRVIVRLGS